MRYQHDTEAGFIRNHQGQIAIYLEDPGFVRSETIVLNMADLSLHAVLFENTHSLGRISPQMASGLRHGDPVTLYARPSRDVVIDMRAPLSIQVQ
ncbi:MAG: hypothetical protein V4621_07025 [Pseudomonadota bacterium]